MANDDINGFVPRNKRDNSVDKFTINAHICGFVYTSSGLFLLNSYIR